MICLETKDDLLQKYTETHSLIIFCGPVAIFVDLRATVIKVCCCLDFCEMHGCYAGWDTSNISQAEYCKVTFLPDSCGLKSCILCIGIGKRFSEAVVVCKRNLLQEIRYLCWRLCDYLKFEVCTATFKVQLLKRTFKVGIDVQS